MALVMESTTKNFIHTPILTEKERIQNFLKTYPIFDKEGIKVIYLKGRKNRFLVEYSEQVHDRINFSPVLSEKEYYDYCLHTDIDRWKLIYGLHLVHVTVLPVHTIHDQESVYWDDCPICDLMSKEYPNNMVKCMTTDQDDQYMFDFVTLKKQCNLDERRDEQDTKKQIPIYGVDYDVEQVGFIKFMVRLIVKG